MAGKLTAAQGTGILLVTANVGSLFEDVSLPIDKRCLSVLVLHAGVLTTSPPTPPPLPPAPLPRLVLSLSPSSRYANHSS